MGRAVEITRSEWTAAELRRMARRSDDGRVSCRLLALAIVLEGATRTAAASAAGMDRQTLRDWVHRYNEGGVAALSDQPGSGRPPLLTPAQMRELDELVLVGPDPERHGVVRWRCIDLRGEIARRFSVEVHERTVGKLLAKLGMVRRQPRPYHPKKDAAAQAAFKKLRCPGSRGGAAGSRRQPCRSVISGRSSCWPAGQHHLRLGAARLAAASIA